MKGTKKAFLLALTVLATVVVSFSALNALRAKAVTEPIPDPCTADNGLGCAGDFNPTLTPSSVPLGGTMQVSGTATGASFMSLTSTCDITTPTLNSPVQWTIAGGNLNGPVTGNFPLMTTNVGSDGSVGTGVGGCTTGVAVAANPYGYSFNFSISALSYGLGAGSYTLTFSATDSMGHVITSDPISFTVLPSGGSGTAGQFINIQSLTPNPAINQISVTGDAAGGINTGGLICQVGGSLGPWVTTEQAVPLPSTGTYSIDGVSLGSFPLFQTQQGIGKECPPPANPAMYEYSFTFSDATDIASLSNGSHTLQVCAGAGLCTSKSFTVQNASPAILQLSTHSINTSGTSQYSQPIQVTNAGPAASQMSWNAGVTYVSGSGWLSVGPSSNPVPVNGGSSQTVTIGVNPASLSPGTYLGMVNFTGTSIVDGSPLSAQSVTVEEIVPGAAPAPTGTITVTSENANNAQTLVNASWDLTGQVGNGSVCSTALGTLWQEVPCSGTQQTYSGVPVTDPLNGIDENYTIPTATLETSVPYYTFNSFRQVPIAETKHSSTFGALGLALNNVFSTVAQAVSISPIGSQTMTTSTPSMAFTILWTPNADMQVSSTNPIDLTNSPSQTVTIENIGAPYSELNWTATTSTTGGGNWFDISSTGDSITNGASGQSTDNITISAAPSLASGTYSGTIVFTGNDAGTGNPVKTPPPTILITLTVSGSGPSPQYSACVANQCVETSTVGASSCVIACGGTETVTCTPNSVQVGGTSQCVIDLNGVPQHNASWTVVSGNSGTIGGSSGLFTATAAGTSTVNATLPDNSSADGTVGVSAGQTCNSPSCQAACTDPTLTATPSSTVFPQSATLSYGCSNVTECQLSSGGQVLQDVSAGPSQTISSTYTTTPSITTTYTLTCVNTSNGYISDSTSTSVEVTVGGSSRCEQNPNGTGCQ